MLYKYFSYLKQVIKYFLIKNKLNLIKKLIFINI